MIVVKITTMTVLKVNLEIKLKFKLSGNLKIQKIICDTGNTNDIKKRIEQNKVANLAFFPVNFIFLIV
jgi:hypothetical protein